jgi:hypothetical protein
VSNLLERFTAEINRHFFLSEFSFSRNQFQAASGSEFELADHLIALPDALFVFQLKERADDAAHDSEAIETWFRKKVIDKGCGQIADSLRFLREQPDLRVTNQRGHAHNLASDRRPVIPILLFATGASIPGAIKAKRHHLSQRAGFVHIIHIRHYQRLCDLLALPSELIAYFIFRREFLLRKPEMVLSEAQIAAQFIAETDAILSPEKARAVLEAAADDNQSFDIGPLLRRFGDKINYLDGAGAGLDYYRILAEFTRLDRAEMRGFKVLLKWAMENVGGTDVEIPARMRSGSTGTGFVVIPVPGSAFALRLNALDNFARLAKYDFGVDRQVGLTLARDGDEIEIDWIFLEWPWQHDPELEKVLAEKYPFRPKPDAKIRYRFPDIPV